MPLKNNHLRYHALSVCIILVGVWLRVSFLDISAFSDEAYTYIFYIRGGLSHILTDYSNVNNHPLYSILAYVCTTFLGNDPVILRIPAFIAGILIIPAVYALGSLIYSRTAGIIAAWFVATNYWLVTYAVLARGYSLMILLMLLAAIIAVRLLKRNQWYLWASFMLCLVGGFYTIPVMIYPAGAICLWLLLRIHTETVGNQKRQMYTRFVMWITIGAVITGLLYAPLIIDSLQQNVAGRSNHLVGTNSLTSPIFFDQFLRESPAYVVDFYRAMTQGYAIVFARILWVFAVISLLKYRQISFLSVPLEWVAAGWIICLYLLMRVIPSLRTFMFFTPLFYLSVAAGITLLCSYIEWHPLRYLLYGMIVLVTVIPVYQHLQEIAPNREMKRHTAIDAIHADIGQNEQVVVPPVQNQNEICDEWTMALLLYEFELQETPYRYISTYHARQVESWFGHSCVVLLYDEDCADGQLIQQPVIGQEYYDSLDILTLDVECGG